MSKPGKKRLPVVAFLFANSLFLIAGALGALIWANVSPDTYKNFVHFELSRLIEGPTEDGHSHDHSHDHSHLDDEKTDSVQLTDPGSAANESGHDSDGHSGAHPWTIHVLVNDLLMALFFAIAAKEVWESFLPNGALSNPRKAMTPLLATLGGIVGPAGIYLGGAILIGQSGWFGQEGDLGRGWAIPGATDIALVTWWPGSFSALGIRRSHSCYCWQSRTMRQG